MTNLLILSSHAVLEYDDLRLFTRLGYDVFMPGGYADPRNGNDMRPGVPEAPYHPELIAYCDEQRVRHAGEPAGWPIFDWAKADLHPELVEWADIIMVNCFPESWIAMQWGKIREKRVIWRTIGQSDPNKELTMRPFAAQGLEIVRYSPAEKRAFEPLGVFAGEDAMIRFSKDPADYGPWTGELAKVGNLAQHGTTPGERDAFINWPFVLAATEGHPRSFVGRNAETVGGRGLEWDELRDWLRHIRCMVYTGTQPASYTLGLMEALLTGVPVISITREWMWLPALFEQEVMPWVAQDGEAANAWVKAYLAKPMDEALRESAHIRQAAIDLFSYDSIGAQWVDYLGFPSSQNVDARLEGAAA